MVQLNGTVLRVVTRLNNAYPYDVETKTTEGEGGNLTYKLVGGFAATLLQELSLLLDFKIQLVTDPPNLTYNFSLGNNMSVDLFAASYSLRADRLKYVHPTLITGVSRARVFLNHHFEGLMQDVVVAPFQRLVWFVLMASAVLLCCVFCVLSKQIDKLGYYSSFFQILSIFVFKDARIHVESIPARVTQCTASIMVFLLMSAYSAKIFSIGAVHVYSITSLSELVKSVFDVSFDHGYSNGSSLQYFAEAFHEDPVMSELLQKVEMSKFVYESFQESMLQVQSRPFAYIIDEETAYYATAKAMGRVPCEIGSISFANLKVPWTMLMGKEFRYKSEINYGLLRLAEIGALKNQAMRWIPGRRSVSSMSSDDCVNHAMGDFSRIQLTQLKTAFLVLTGGASIALTFLVLEIVSRRKMDINLAKQM